ncbi:MAG: AraC family transcriptional regulator [Candidatus Protistobacter heckmanni]|nr:AraC family transcriptional regulator [Candidatus Protistobacter heckmanni]
MPLLWAGLAILNSARDWRDDLVEGRRRLRTLIVAAAAGCTLLQALAIWLTGSTPLDVAGSTASAALLAALAMAVSWQLLGTAGGGDWLTASEAPAAPAAAANAAQAANGSARVVHVHARQAAALDTLLLQQRVYREPSLTIAALAARMGMPEYKLRRLINQGLGHRNFNSFLNGYRIAEARRVLQDPAQAQTPVLAVAMDVGFQSVGPFNRAFKTAVGLTPTEFRRQALETAGAAAGSGDAAGDSTANSGSA